MTTNVFSEFSEMKNLQQNVVENETDLFKMNNPNKTSETSNIINNVTKTDAEMFTEKVNNYVLKNKPCVYILTPCFASLCYVNYVHCLMATKEIMRKFNIDVFIEFCKNDSLVSRARNNLVAKAMSNPNMTHIMFIDNDITWDPTDILKLLMSEKQLVGGVYPLKHYHWGELLVDKTNPYNSNIIQSWITKKNQSQFKDLFTDEQYIQHKLLKYNINYLENTLSIDQNLAKVRHLATGFMMIKRDVIEKMSTAFPSTKYTDDVSFLQPEENKFAYALFDCGVEDDHYFSEDWLFCHRWSKMGGEIWIDVSIILAHTGIEDFAGCYISSII
jgi:acyl-CoA synthetase (AMP-forming)/AMP-acid ligase II